MKQENNFPSQGEMEQVTDNAQKKLKEFKKTQPLPKHINDLKSYTQGLKNYAQGLLQDMKNNHEILDLKLVSYINSFKDITKKFLVFEEYFESFVVESKFEHFGEIQECLFARLETVCDLNSIRDVLLEDVANTQAEKDLIEDIIKSYDKNNEDFVIALKSYYLCYLRDKVTNKNPGPDLKKIYDDIKLDTSFIQNTDKLGGDIRDFLKEFIVLDKIAKEVFGESSLENYMKSRKVLSDLPEFKEFLHKLPLYPEEANKELNKDGMSKFWDAFKDLCKIVAQALSLGYYKPEFSLSSQASSFSEIVKNNGKEKKYRPREEIPYHQI